MDWLVSPNFVGAHHAFVDGPVGKILSSTKFCTSFLTDKDNFPARLNSLEVCVFATRMTILPDSDFLVPAEKREYQA